MNSMETERRGQKRCTISQLIDMTLMRERDLQAETVNISEGGVLCKSPSWVEPLTPVYMMFKIPSTNGERTIKVEGTVMHTKQVGEECIFGIAFGRMTGSDEKALRSFMVAACTEAANET
jgi:hypothetical protein